MSASAEPAATGRARCRFMGYLPKLCYEPAGAGFQGRSCNPPRAPAALTRMRTAGVVRYASGISSISTICTAAGAAPAAVAFCTASSEGSARAGFRPSAPGAGGLPGIGAGVEDAGELTAHGRDRGADRVRRVEGLRPDDLADARQVV